MPQINHVEEIVKEVEKLLAQAAERDIHLKTAGHKLDDDWLYIVVVPSRSGQRASDHASYMSQVERQLKAQGHEKVLLVPALED